MSGSFKIAPRKLAKITLHLVELQTRWPITVAARSKARTVFARSNAGIVVSNPTQGMDCRFVCIYCVRVVLCVGRGLATR
jgi:hypothetical protein